jgi:hypothetical protein
MDRLIVWGGTRGAESHRWIHFGFVNAARKMGVTVRWLPDAPDPLDTIQAGDTVISADIYGQHIPYVPNVDYVLHNFSGDHPLCQSLQETPERLLRLQVWTNDATGEMIAPYRKLDREARTLFQPWGVDLLAEEFEDPTFSSMSREVVFVGAIWSDQHSGVEMGNEDAIRELRAACKENGLTFKHLTQISEREMIDAIRGARLAPTVVGQWQCDHDYIPCRAFKNSAYGTLVFSNSKVVNALFDDPSATTDVSEMLSQALSVRHNDFLDRVRAQQKITAEFTYRESLNTIEFALAEGRDG